jgi:hypothetical protein
MNTTTKETPVNAEEYNGYTNRETWAASLHLDNDRAVYEMILNRAVKIALDHSVDGFIMAPADINNAQRLVRELVESHLTAEVEAVYHEPERATNYGRMAAADIGSLWRVDWDEIASGWLDHAAEVIGMEVQR